MPVPYHRPAFDFITVALPYIPGGEALCPGRCIGAPEDHLLVVKALDPDSCPRTVRPACSKVIALPDPGAANLRGVSLALADARRKGCHPIVGVRW